MYDLQPEIMKRHYQCTGKSGLFKLGPSPQATFFIKLSENGPFVCCIYGRGGRLQGDIWLVVHAEVKFQNRGLLGSRFQIGHRT